MEQIESVDELVAYARAVVDATEEWPENLDDETVKNVSLAISAAVYEQFGALAEQSETTLGVEDFAQLIPAAIGAAFIAGFVVANPTNPAGASQRTKEGTIVNIYIT